MRLSKKTKYISIVCFLLLFLIIVKFYLLPKLQSPRIPLPHRVAFDCFTVKKALEVYYAKMSEDFLDNPIHGFITFLMDADSSFSDQAPVSPYKSEEDMSFYLFLPRKLDYPNPLLIGYTNSFEASTKQSYRNVMFLRNGEIAVVRLREEVLVDIIGKETYTKKKPDFYIWKKRTQYLEQTYSKGKLVLQRYKRFQ